MTKFMEIKGQALDKLKENVAKDIFGLTIAQAKKSKICIECKQPPTFYSKAGEKEYEISALCEPCFDKIANFEV